MPKPPRRRVAGLTLVESALLLSLAGVVLAIAVPTLSRAIQTSKVSEASQQLSTIYAGVAAYYAEARPTANGPAHCMPEAAGPTPVEPSASPVPVDFAAVPSWVAIGFTPQEPLRYRYTFIPTVTSCDPAAPLPAVTLRAEGDLDDDGVYSTFERSAQAAAYGRLVPAAVLRVRDRVE